MSHAADPDEIPPDKVAKSAPSSPHHTPIASEDPTLTAGRVPSGTPGRLENPVLAPGAQLPDFELIEIIGRGGMGVVYKARQKSLDRLVAIKMLLSEHGQNELALTRFRAESKAAAGLSHPNIVSIHQVGECPFGHFFAMEYIEGQTLQEVLDKQFSGKPVSIARSVNLMVAVAEAVAYAHSKGVIHRDLKPGNIMIDKFKRPIVMDFGIAKVTGTRVNLTGPGVVMGTPAYIPPEQTGECPGEVGPHSDVYALGAILYRLLTGKPVYEAETTLRTILLVVGPDMPAAAHQLRAEVPAQLSAVCMKCLNKLPEERYPDAAVLARELRGCRSLVPPSTSGIQPVLPPLVLVSAKTGKAIGVPRSSTMIGRGSDCEIILKSAEVSKRHCRIVIQDNRAEVEDLESVNGTLLNGEPIRRVFLKNGDVLELGDHSFTVRLSKPLH
jgi:serine/threonine protein kinase